MTEAEIVGVAAAARRLRGRCEWLEMQATEEFTRRYWEDEPAKGPEKGPDGRWKFKGRDAEQAHKELAMELVDDSRAAEERMDLSLALRDRLPLMAALLAAGQIDRHRCEIVHAETSVLSDEDARMADAMIGLHAPELRYDALRRKARVVALMLDPDSDRQRKERATRRKARVEVFPEKSGNYAVAGRELPAGDALASKAHVQGIARDLKSHGVPGTVREIEVMVYLDLTQGRDPYDRLPRDESHGGESHEASQAAGSHDRSVRDTGGERGSATGPYGDDPGSRRQPRDWDGEDDWHGQDWDEDDEDEDDSGNGGGPRDEGGRRDPGVGGGRRDPGGGSRWPFSPPGHGMPGDRAPFPASIHLLVTADTLLGWSNRPGEAGRDIIDPQTMRDLVQAASHHSRTRWDVTLVGADGTAIAHGRARGQNPWNPRPPGVSGTDDTSDHAGNDRDGGTASRDGPGRALDGTSHQRETSSAPAPASALTPAQRAKVAGFLAGLGVTFTTIAKGSCDHAGHEDRYRPSAALQGLIRARNATCPSPVCDARAHHNDIDHTNPWPLGPTDQCNLGPPCRGDHRTKQAPGWLLEQPEPGVFRWKTPNGRSYWTHPTQYDV
jgi:hypothetical protein